MTYLNVWEKGTNKAMKKVLAQSDIPKFPKPTKMSLFSGGSGDFALISPIELKLFLSPY